MDTISIAALATDLSQARTEQAVQLAVLKKAMDVQAQGAMLLVEAAAQVIPNNPPHLGNSIDTFA
jgi:hypothetical protein